MGLYDTNMPYTNLHDLNLDWLIKTIKQIQAGEEPEIPTSLFGVNGAGMPYTNLHELNLDWIIEKITELSAEVEALDIHPATETPLMDQALAQIGTSLKYAREDHAHPTDTTRASETDMVAVKARMDTAESDIDTLQATSATHTSEINSAKARLDVDEGNISTLFNNKQKKLQAGSNIVITEGSDYDTISASGEIAVDYSTVTNKPSINGVTVNGAQTSSDLDILHTVMLYSDGLQIYDDAEMTNALTFLQVKALLDDTANDVKLWNENYILTPEYSTTQSGVTAIWFNGTTSLSGKTYLYRITINSDDEVINTEYQLINKSDIATSSALGLVKAGTNVTVASDGTLGMVTASSSVLGGVKVGSRLSISNGVLSADEQSYTLPTASASVLGGIKVGNNLTITDGVLNAEAGGMTVDLLWTNSSPTSEFPAQTLSIDLSTYTYIILIVKGNASTAGDHYFTHFFKVGDTYTASGFGTAENMIRTFTATSSGITITTGYAYLNYGASTLSANDGRLIPYKIYAL